MKYKKIMLVTCLLLAILTISAVSANENTTEDIVGMVDEVREVDNDLASSEDVLKESTKTFTDLNNTLNANEDKEIYLYSNYSYDVDESDFSDGIVINRSVTINGNGYTIDGNDAARIFNVTDENSIVVFKNIIFVNGYSAGMGGAIYGNTVDNTVVINCTFIGNSAENGGAIAGATVKDCIFTENTATDYGGAIYYGVVENSIFNGNTADMGGAIFYTEVVKSSFNDNYASGDGGAIYGAFVCEECNFTYNSALFNGGAIYGADDVVNSIFIENSADCGGALDTGNAFNCTFIGNSATDCGGAMYSDENHAAINCIFEDNFAKNGGAAYKINATGCEFTNNAASEYGGAMYDGNAVNCDFENNTADVDGDDFYDFGNKPEVEITSQAFYDDWYVTIVRYYFPENATGSISIYIDGSDNASYSSEIITGKWVRIYEDDLAGFELLPGSYDIEVVYSGDESYGKYTWQSTLDVIGEEDDENVSADFNITFSQYHTFNQEVIKGRGTYDASFEFPLRAGGNVLVYVDDEYWGVEDVDFGDVFIEIETANLTLGKHQVKFVYSGDGYFNSSTAYDSFNVTYIRYEVPHILRPNSMGASAYAALTVLPYDATGEVKLIVDDIEKATQAVDEGSVVYYLPNYLTYGNHSVSLIYQNGNYPSSSKKFKVESLIKTGECTVSFNATGGEGEMANATVEYNTNFTLPECGFTKDNRVFYGWSVGDSIKQPGENITVSGDIAIGTVWRYYAEIQPPSGGKSTVHDASVDASMTYIEGTLILIDSRTGEVFVENITADPVQSSYAEGFSNLTEDMINVTVNQLLGIAKTHAGDKTVLVINQTVSNATRSSAFDHRTYNWLYYYEYAEGVDLGLNSFRFLSVGGSYGSIWNCSVLIEAEYASGSSCMVSFNATGGEGEMANVVVENNAIFTLPECEFTKEYRVFYGWNVGDAIKQPGENITVIGDIAIKTVWRSDSEINDTTGKAEVKSIAVDLSTTSIDGRLLLTDLSTGAVYLINITVGPVKSDYANPGNATVIGDMINDAVNQLLNLAKLQTGGKLVTVKNQTVSDVTFTELNDTRIYALHDYYEGADGLIESPRFLFVSGDYGTAWTYPVLLEAEYASVVLVNIADVKVELSKTAFVYNANVQKPTVTLSNGAVLTEGVDYTLQWSAASPKNVGTYTVTVTGTGAYNGTVKATFKINKAVNPLSIKAKTVKVKFSTLKKKKQVLAVSKVIKFTKKGQGTLTYVKSSGNKKITINKKNGKVTVKKGLKKGTYKVKVKIKAAGNANYNASAYKAVTFKIIIK